MRTYMIGLSGLVALATVRTLSLLDLGGEWGSIVVTNIAAVIIALGATAVLLYAAGALRARGRSSRHWLLLGAGMGFYALGNIVWSWMLIIERTGVPYPGIPDILYFASYVCLGLGLTGSVWAFKDLSDIRSALGIGVTAGISLWGLIMVLLGIPYLAETLGVPLLEKVVSLAYVTADVFILLVPALVVILVLLRLQAVDLAVPWGLLVVGCLLIAASDTTLAIQNANSAYKGGGLLLDYGWMAAHIALALAGTTAVDVYSGWRPVLPADTTPGEGDDVR